MAPLKLPAGLKAAQLKHAAFLIGVPTAGTKSELETLISKHLKTPSVLSKPKRVISIDMGIKNLGICALETPSLPTLRNLDDNGKSRLKVIDWKKLDLLASMPIAHNTDRVECEGAEQKVLSSASFTPSALSKTALLLSEDILQSYSPDHILIERQRFRSGGAAAVQEWTLRVNMLESMIWACLTTLSASNKAGTSFSIHEVSPARVAKFWCLGADTNVPHDIFNGKDTSGGVALSGKGVAKISKHDKIAVVKSWLDADNFQLSDPATETARSFLSATKAGRKPKHVDAKVDDLADCFLQGAAWVRWEENRQRILQLLG